MNCQNSALEKPRSSLLHDGQTVEALQLSKKNLVLPQSIEKKVPFRDHQIQARTISRPEWNVRWKKNIPNCIEDQESSDNVIFRCLRNVVELNGPIECEQKRFKNFWAFNWQKVNSVCTTVIVIRNAENHHVRGSRLHFLKTARTIWFSLYIYPNHEEFGQVL